MKIANTSVESLKVIAEQLQNTVETILSDVSDSFLTEALRIERNRLLCRAQEWKSNAFFVIVVGPVKSGKSTFVNLLAHEHVSPTHFLECTVRPSIISQKRKGEPSEIIPFITEGKPSIEHVDSIIDHIKGLGSDAPGLIKKEKPCELNKENLDKKVSYRIGLDNIDNEKVALTSITADGGEFLKEDIYLIDMPGFDGVRANLDEAFYEALVNRADLVVFVQSSNSAINKISEEFCSLIQKRNGSVPIFFIHNYFDSAYWHTKEEKDRVTDGHIKKAMEFFKEHHLLIEPDNCHCINLGKVTDAREIDLSSPQNICMPEYESMLMEEERMFTDIEHNLHKKISAGQSRVRLINCINRTIREADIFTMMLLERKDYLASKKHEYDKMNEMFGQLKTAIEPISPSSVFDIEEKYSQLINLLKDIQILFSRNIAHTQKYDTCSTRQKATGLIDAYKVSTELFVNNVFKPDHILREVELKCNAQFMTAVPAELRRYSILNKYVRIDKTSIQIDYSSITKEYDVNKQIPHRILKKRKGGQVVDHMIDIEHKLFGLSTDNPCGFIPQQFFEALKGDIEEWIDNIIRTYQDIFLQRIEESRRVALAEIIPDLTAHEAEQNKIERLIKGMKGIIEKMGEQYAES